MHDVVIVGAGPAGSALAMELARDGHSVLLLEGARFPRDKPCGDYLSPRALASLERLGCGPAVRAMGSTPIRSSRLYLGRDQLVCGSLPHVSGLPDHGLAIPRRELDHLIYRRAIEAGAEGREGCRVTGFEVAHDRIEAIGTLDGKPWRGAGRLLIGADGATSAVARAAGLPMNDDRYTMASIRAYATGLCLDHTLMYFNEKYFPGYGWIFPIRPGLCNIGVGMVSEPLIRERLRLGDFYALFVKLVQQLARSRGAAVQI